MDNLIDKSNFTGLTALVGMAQDWNESDLDAYITLYQEELLKRFLGESLYNDLDDNYVASNGDKWDKLVNGDTYTYTYSGSDYTIKYKGVKELLTYLIYFFYKSDLATGTTGGGEVVSSYENSTVSKLDRKAIKSFNLGVDLIGDIYSSLDIDYVEVKHSDLPFFVTGTSIDPLKANLYNYITFKNDETEDTYPNWIFKGYDKINEFGI